MKYLAALLLLSSCATIIQGEEQTLKVSLSGATSANCELTDNRDAKSFTAPGEVVIGRSIDQARIECVTATGERGSIDILSDVSNWGYGGALLGTVIGAGVDTYTGASFEYPEEVTVEIGMNKLVGQTNLN